VPDSLFQDLPVLVTGGAGFIGSHLTEELVALGARVRVLDDFSTGQRENLADVSRQIDLVEGDLREREACAEACRGVSLVFHQAALGSVPRSMADPATSLEVNVQGSANLFAAARDAKVARVIYASSSSVYGDSTVQPRTEGQEGRPMSPYAASKRMTEELAEVFGAAYGMRFVGLRYFNVYGPRQRPDGPYAAVVPRFFKAAIAGEPLPIYGDGEQSRDFTYVADAVRANLLAAGAPVEADGAAYNVAGGHETTINRLADLVCSLLGRETAAQHEPARPGDVRHSLADLERARVAIGYEPTTELERGLSECRAGYERILPPAGS
jgi:UDP-N-acetylglucosamine/UDP-N-acetyl-alpha-D-glucosaminouronate 4-epimerase